MFRRKNDKRIVELNPEELRLAKYALLVSEPKERIFSEPEELRLAKYALLGFRNKLVAQGKPTEGINALLLKIMK